MARGTNPNSLKNLIPAKPGEIRNPLGRKTAGATVKEWLNTLAEKRVTEAQLRSIARNRKAEWARRTAAERMLRTLEAGDMADFQAFLHGEKSLDELKEAGVNTEVLKKIKVKTRTLGDGTHEV